MSEQQSFANHARYVPTFHFFALPVFLINFIWHIYRLVRPGISPDGIVSLFVALALLVLCFRARIFALTVQDRVIRLEERLRYERLLPADLKPRIAEFTVNQLVSLRFASDAELPALARKVLAERLDNRKAIKRLVQRWQPDHLRA